MSPHEDKLSEGNSFSAGDTFQYGKVQGINARGNRLSWWAAYFECFRFLQKFGRPFGFWVAIEESHLGKAGTLPQKQLFPLNKALPSIETSL